MPSDIKIIPYSTLHGTVATTARSNIRPGLATPAFRMSGMSCYQHRPAWW